MTFSDFANLLNPIISGSNNTITFTRKLFETLIGDENFSIIEDLSDDSFKAYFNGNLSIHKIAKKISPYADPENFIAYLDTFGDSVSQKLLDAFSSSIDDINLQNVNYKVSYYFDEIIKEAAKAKRKSTQKSANNNVSSDSINNEEKRTLIQNQINVIQNGNTNLNLTNTGTIEFNFGGANK